MLIFDEKLRAEIDEELKRKSEVRLQEFLEKYGGDIDRLSEL